MMKYWNNCLSLYLMLIYTSYNIATGCSSQSLSSYNESSFSGGEFSSGIQLLIPSWNFTCQGTITSWTAHVTGDTSIADLIEFQIFEPDSVEDGVYHAVYGSLYRGDNAQDSMITIPVDNVQNIPIPIRPEYIVGVYIPPSVANNLSLLYEDTGDTDVYYWENIENRTCDFSLCSGKVMRNINPLIGWTFMETSLTSIQTTLDNLKQDIMYCTEVDVSDCVNPTVQPSSTSSSYSSISLITSSQDFISLSITASPSPTSTPTSPNPLSFLTPELTAALCVVFFLILVVLILALSVCICCFLRRKPVPEVSITQAFDNPDYNGVISMGSVKKPTESVNTISSSLYTHKQSETTFLSPSPPPEFDDDHYYPRSSLQSHTVSQINTQRTGVNSPPPNTTTTSSNNRLSGSSNSHVPPPSILSSFDSNRAIYAVLEPDSGKTGNNVNSEVYYSLPPSDVKTNEQIPQPSIYDVINEHPPEVPSSIDPEFFPGYDQINVPPTTKSATIATPRSYPSPQNTKDVDPAIYAYVPTEEQRKIMQWRYEMPIDIAYDKLKFFEEKHTFWAPATTTSGLYEQLASNKYREVPRDDIQIATTLGQGQFGSVSKGSWKSPDGRHDVAIKMLKPNATEDDRLKLLQEAAIMGQFTDKYVVKLLGVVTVGDPVMIILEFMPRGDLRSYLRSIRPKHGKWQSPPPGLPKLLLKFCRDIARGMRYLSQKSFVHRDLAARNILLSLDLTCKIGDFGMARDLMEDENNYYKSSGGIIPVKWTAPEALNYKKYTTASDVWSYGMVLFEIWSLGHKPFSELSNPIVIALVNSKHCQAPPPGCSKAVYELMVECWNPEHSQRPPFSSIVVYLETSDEDLLKWNEGDRIVGKNAHILGAPLEESSDLFINLQRVYQNAMLKEQGRKRSKSNV